SDEGRARLAQLARPLVGKVPAGLFRELLVSRLGQLVRLPPEKVSKLILDAEPQPKPSARRPAGSVQAQSAVRTALALLLRRPDLGARVQPTACWDDLPSAGLDLLMEMAAVTGERPDLSTAALLERWREHPAGQHLYKLLRDDDPNQLDNLEQVFDDALAQIEREARAAHAARRCEELSGRGLAKLSAEEKAELAQLMQWLGGRG
ncbi:MAG TPA: hypothetical protein VIW02_03265, partial [Gammaproteobacteria bacterium]